MKSLQRRTTLELAPEALRNCPGWGSLHDGWPHDVLSLAGMHPSSVPLDSASLLIKSWKYVGSFAFHSFRMKVAVVVALLVSSATARPQDDRRQQPADESEVGDEIWDNLFHGSHPWGLEGFHEDAGDRKKRDVA